MKKDPTLYLCMGVCLSAIALSILTKSVLGLTGWIIALVAIITGWNKQEVSDE